MTRAAAGFLDLGPLLRPASIVVVGASAKPGNFGGETLRNLKRFGFEGPVLAVNRSGGEVDGQQCYTDVALLPIVPDLAVLSVPVEALLDSVKACVAKGIKAGIAYAGGLRETGVEGARLQAEIAAYCREHGFVLNGPNGLGVINLGASMAATFSTQLASMQSLVPGGISIVSQSGGIATNLMKLIDDEGFGAQMLVSSGNEAVVSCADIIVALARDADTRVIATYLEGIDDGPRFVRALQLAREAGKPVVMIKGGVSPASAAAAKAHTGALTGEDRVFDQIVRSLGVIRVDSVQDLLDTSIVLAGSVGRRGLAGRGVGIATIGGGNGVMAVDRASALGLEVPPLDEPTSARLAELLVSVATASNPVDLTPASFLRPDAFEKLPQVFGTLAAVEGIDVLFLIIGSMVAHADRIATMLEEFTAHCEKPVVVAWPPPPPGIPQRLAKAGIATFGDVARGISAIARVADGLGAAGIGEQPVAGGSRWGELEREPRGAFVLSEDAASAKLRDFGIPVAESELAVDRDAALAAAHRLGYPVALKAISPEITHRAAVGALALDIRNDMELIAEFERIRQVGDRLGAPLEGQLVERMHEGRVEILASIFRDAVFGPVISIGSGGVLTELLDDVRLALAPIDEARALELLRELKVVRKFTDSRLEHALSETAKHLATLSEQAVSAPWPRYAFEINPIKVGEAGPIAVDALLVVEEES